jgi:DNA-binding CsgD family transcriptional regulator
LPVKVVQLVVSATVMLRFAIAVLLAESVTCAVKGNVPDDVGVPVIWPLLIHRDTGRPLQISVLPFQSNSLLFGAAPCALILLHDPDAQSASRSAILSAIYHLTPAECRLADLLHQDFDVAQAAEVLGITQGTARFMLKNVFRKTRTHRQPELIRFLLGIPSVSSQ